MYRDVADQDICWGGGDSGMLVFISSADKIKCNAYCSRDMDGVTFETGVVNSLC